MTAKKSGFTHDSVKNKSVDWYTPVWVFEALGLQFDLDPCQPEQKIPWVPATQHYCEAQDGLKQPWHGLVWLNPPYGTHTRKWLQKMNSHGNGVALVFARTDCRWFKEVAACATGILFLQKRIKFVDGLGVTSGNGAGAGSMLIAWGEEAATALKGMKQFGVYFGNKGRKQ